VAKALTVMMGAAIAICLMVTAIWAWRDLPLLSATAARPDVLAWAAKSLAVAAGAGAQVILITFVLGRIYRFKRVHDALRLAAALVCCVGAIGAAALGLAAQQ